MMQNRQVDEFSLTQYAISGADLNTAPSHPVPHQGETTSTGGTLLVPMGFVILVWTVLVLVRLDFWKTFRNRLTPVKRCNTKIPCANCRFFNNDPYLKCAVQPSKVLSEEAIDCPDYWHEDKNKFWQ